MKKIIDWLDAHLIPEWRKACTLLSVQFGLVGSALAGVWLALSDDQQAALLAWLHINPKWVAPIGFLLAIYLRLKRQGKKGGDDQ